MDKWWVPGLQIGYEHSFVHQVADFLMALKKGEPCGPTFRVALENAEGLRSDPEQRGKTKLGGGLKLAE